MTSVETAVAAGAIPDLRTLFGMDGEVVVVTGASSGLGHRFARLVHAVGATVVLSARREERLRSIAGTLERSHVIACDVNSADQRRALVAETVDRLGRIDVLINNAGTSRVAKALDESDEDFEGLLDVNLVAPFSLARHAARVMLDQGSGRIVNVASIVGLVGVGRMPQAGYAASKGGLVNLTRELAAQWARHGIRVNALAPGFFPSEMTAELFESERGQQWLERLTPMARGGRDGELDAALLFLASEASSYVTGQVVTVDGGWTAV